MLINKFISQAKIYENNVAVKTNDGKITYKQLDLVTNALANEIVEKYNNVYGKQCSKTIALLFNHGIDMIIGTIASVKSNITYVPLLNTYPVERLKYIIKDANVGAILVDNSNLELLKELISEFRDKYIIINVDDDKYKLSVCDLVKSNIENDIAYILYTSGSTGKPKGVYQSYENLEYFISEYTKKLNITSNDKLTLFSSIGHDASLVDIYTALLSGATLYPVEIKNISNFEDISVWLNDEKITIWHSVPTVYRYWVKSQINKNKFTHLRYIVLGGEQVVENDFKSYKRLFDDTKLINLYGQTESSINSIEVFDVKNDSFRITIGEPIGDTDIAVINEDREEADTFEIGEIVIISDNVALGYWHNKTLTEKVFKFDDESTNLYFTGDLGRVLEDGKIEFIGRKDSVVKIRGYRIDMGDIESNLMEYSDINEVAVINSKADGEEDKLYAFLVSRIDLNIDTVKEFVRKKLPDYMIPNTFIQIEKLPTTQTSKIDRQALNSMIENIKRKKEYIKPVTEKEKKLVEIWKEVLEVDKVGMNDDFFDLGGHSLKATFLINKIQKEFNVDIRLKDLFANTKVSQLLDCISSKKENYVSMIEKSEKKEYYEASSAQKRIFAIQQIDKQSTAYNIVSIFEINKNYDENRINECFMRLIKRHDSLRTHFKIIDGELFQRIETDIDFSISNQKVNNKSVEDIKKDFVKPFDLEKGPLIRVEIIQNNNKSYMLIDIHHIISDAISMGILISDFISIYNNKELEPLRIQYKDFSEWQNKFLKSVEIEEQEKYWISQFSDDVEVLNLPYDYEIPVLRSFEGDIERFSINEDYTVKLRKIAKETNSTIHMVLLSAIDILLAKYCRQDDIVIGVPVAGRLHADLENTMGMFVNTLAIKNKPSREKKYIEFLYEVRDNSIKAYENQSYQFEKLVEKLNISRDTSRNPLFDVIFNMYNLTNNVNQNIDGLILNVENKDTKITKFDLGFNVIENENNIEFKIEYCTKLFKCETIKRMSTHLLQVIKNICDNSEMKISQINILSEQEKNTLLANFNYISDSDINNNETITSLFENQVKKTPDSIAVVFEQIQLTYKELNDRANIIASQIRDKGVKPNSIVALMVERSIEMVIGIIAILKSGAAYLAIDLKHPKDRIEYLLNDCDVKILLTRKQYENKIDFSGDIIDLTNDCTQKQLDIKPINKDKDLAYVIYTSGTTGRPKAVMIEHRSIVNTLLWRKEYYKFDTNDAVLQIPTYTFDSSVEDILTPLISGSRVVIINQDKLLDTVYMKEMIIKNKVTNFLITPTFYNSLLDSGLEGVNTFRILTVAGESLHESILSKHFDIFANVPIINEYGPTENSVCSTAYRFDGKTDNILIGKPINNTKVYILDEDNNLMPIGVAGELCVSGTGLSRGYLHNEELTAKKFVENPFEKGKHMYRTGDLARWLPNGEIEFLGRIDNQVKVRGFRIELGEIENALLKFNGIKEAVVLAKDNNKYLCAYIVCDGELETRAIREHLKSMLPEYMIPSFYIKIDKIPLTSNGKVNTKKLLDTKIENTNVEKILPRSLQEHVIAEIWQDVLKLEKVYVSDDFFELGGNSINIIQVAKEIKERLQMEINISDLMVYTKIIDLAEFIIKSSTNKEKSKYKHLYKINKSTSEKKIFIIHGGDGDIFYFRHLAKLLENEYSVYGIQPSGLSGKEPLPLSFYEMLVDYITEIRAIQPEGPYILAGYCVGGYLAYDITKLFELQGIKVKALLELDQEPFVYEKYYKIVSRFERALKCVELWRKITRRDNMYTINKLKSLFEKKYVISKERQMEIIKDRLSIRKFFTTELIAKCNYCYFARSIKSSTLVVKAKDNHNKIFELDSWENMTQNRLEFYEIPGTHDDILSPPYVEKLSEIVLQFLRTEEN